MIQKSEILKHANQLELSPNTVEKDYVLNWLLAGIASVSELKQHWIFKGGICLKKCFFQNYRFSEDLDFTITDEHLCREAILLEHFSKVRDWVYEQSGIEIPPEQISFKEYTNPRNKRSIEGKVAYRGPLGRRGDLT